MHDKTYTCRRDILADMVKDYKMSNKDILDKYSFVYNMLSREGCIRSLNSRRNFFNSQEEFNQSVIASMDTVRMVVSKYLNGTILRELDNVEVRPYLTRLYINWFNHDSLDQAILVGAGRAIGEEIVTFLISTLTEQEIALRRASTGDFEAMANRVSNRRDKSYAKDDAAAVDAVGEVKLFAPNELKSSTRNMDEFKNNLDKILSQVEKCRSLSHGKKR